MLYRSFFDYTLGKWKNSDIYRKEGGVGCSVDYTLGKWKNSDIYRKEGGVGCSAEVTQ